MKFLVVGQGGREHALVRALKLSPSVTEVHAVPGSSGIATEAICHSMNVTDLKAWESLLQQHQFSCVVIGPEVPLAFGLADFLRGKGVPTVGPSQTAARLEASKIFAKQFMADAGVPTARFEIVESVEETLARAEKFSSPYVLKADGLAAGKGVIICQSKAELEHAAHSFFVDKVFGDAGRKAVLEEFQRGYELSYLVLTNGMDYRECPVTQDHKRLNDKNLGPNTGGMGVVGPVPVSSDLRDRIRSEIVEPSLKHLHGLGLLYRGVLYFGVMVTSSGPSLLEFNVRFGDPEAQVILPLFDGDWGVFFLRLSEGELLEMKWLPRFAACVVMAAPGYPDKPESNVPISGNLGFQTPSSYYLHAGTKFENGAWKTSGGRVLNAVGLGNSLKDAIANAYTQTKAVKWSGQQMRSDIGQNILEMR